MHKKLFIPGPVEVRPEVLAKMAEPMIGHRSKDASALQRRISDNMRRIFFTESEILLSTTSGSGLMEGAIRCCTAKKAAVFSVGAFGKRWYEMAVSNNVQADLYEVEMGKAVDPKDVDKCGIDVCITSTQKCIGLPPGMSICTFSEKARKRAEQVPNRGYYLDLLQLYKYIQKKDYQYPSTPSLSHMFALDYQLDYILNEEGLENRFARHKEMAQIVRDWAEKNFELYSDKNHLSNTVTNVKNTKNIDVSALNKALGERGFQISNGYGSLKDKTFRIAHMADCQVEDVKELLKNIDEILGL